MNLVEWGLAAEPLTPGGESGDLHVVTETDTAVLLAVIDGLGHGPEAAVAAREAARVLLESPDASPLAHLEACHGALRQTRGVVMSVVSLAKDRPQLCWAGVGNIETLVLRRHGAPSAIVAAGGIVGYNLPRLRMATVDIAAGDWLVMASDGLKSGFARDISLDAHPQQEAERILARHRRTSDDALVLLARYRGTGFPN